MLNKSIEKREIEKGQMGLFAQKYIKKNDVVWKLDSLEKILTKDERDNLPQEIRKFAFQYKSGYIVVHDGSQYMNHSCDPNTCWTSDTELSALREVKAGEEITYDYSTVDIGDWVAGWECKCGSPKCRHRITGRDCLNPDFQKKYKNHLPTWTEDYIHNHQLLSSSKVGTKNL